MTRIFIFIMTLDNGFDKIVDRDGVISHGSDNIILFQGVTGDRLAGGAAHLLHLFFFLPRPQHTM